MILIKFISLSLSSDEHEHRQVFKDPTCVTLSGWTSERMPLAFSKTLSTAWEQELTATFSLNPAL